MSTEPLYLDKAGAIAEIVLNRPDKLNALNEAAWRMIPDLIAEVEADRDVRVLIVRGVDAVAFAAGADISEFAEVHASAARARQYHDVIAAALDGLARVDRPTIAMIRGLCYGGGSALALACDIRYADPTARFSIPPARLGLAYSLRETKRLVDLVGPSKAKEMLFGARTIDADEALACGFITRLFPADRLAAEVQAFAEELAGLSQYSIRAIKKIVRAIEDGAETDTDETRALMLGAFEAPDYTEGRDAFLAKRPPKFTYR